MADEIIVEQTLDEEEEMSLNDGRADLSFIVMHTGGIALGGLAARNALLLSPNVPFDYHGLLRQTTTMKRDPNAPHIWRASLKFGKLERRISLKTDGACERTTKTFSKENIGNFNVRLIDARGGEGPDFGRLVNVQKDKIKGAEVYEPLSPVKITASWQEPFGGIEPGYTALLKSLRGMVNNADIAITVRGQEHNWPRGSLLCTGFSTDEGNNDNARISISFVEYLSDHSLVIGERDGRLVASQAMLDAALLCAGAATDIEAQVDDIQDAESAMNDAYGAAALLSVVPGVNEFVYDLCTQCQLEGARMATLASAIASQLTAFAEKLSLLNTLLTSGQVGTAQALIPRFAAIQGEIAILSDQLGDAGLTVTDTSEEAIAEASGESADTIAAAAATEDIVTAADGIITVCGTAIGFITSGLATADAAMESIGTTASPANAPIDVEEGAFYAWIHTIKTQDSRVGTQVEVPDSVHIERFYDYADFAQFGIFDTLEDFDDDLADDLEEEAEEEAEEE